MAYNCCVGGGCLHRGELVQGFIFGDRWEGEQSWSKAAIKALNPLCQITNRLSSSPPQKKASVVGVGTLWEVKGKSCPGGPYHSGMQPGGLGGMLHKLFIEPST